MDRGSLCRFLAPAFLHETPQRVVQASCDNDSTGGTVGALPRRREDEHLRRVLHFRIWLVVGHELEDRHGERVNVRLDGERPFTVPRLRGEPAISIRDALTLRERHVGEVRDDLGYAEVREQGFSGVTDADAGAFDGPVYDWRSHAMKNIDASRDPSYQMAMIHVAIGFHVASCSPVLVPWTHDIW